MACKKDEEDYFSRNFVCLLRTTKTRHIVSFIDVYFHFLANFQTYCPHMFSIFTHVIRNPYVTQNNSEPGLPVHLIEYYTSTYKWNYNNKLTDVINRTIRTSKEKKRTCCVIAGNRHYILDLKHNKKNAFFLLFIPNFKITQKLKIVPLSTTQNALFTNFTRTSWSLRFLRNCPPTPPLSQHFAQKEK